jgi:hypothetical protein
MRTSRRSRFAAIAVVMPTILLAAPPPGTRLSFVSCPILRDTRSVPCWLSDYQSDRYYLTIQTDVSAEVQPPLMGHQVLVEGVVSDKPSICGGIVLSQVHLSAMPELDANCREELPAEDRYTVDAPRPPGPSSGRFAFSGDTPGTTPGTTPAADPAPAGARGAGAGPGGGARAGGPGGQASAPPAGPQKFDVYYDFDKGVSFRHPGSLGTIINAARRGAAKSMRITGVRGAHKLSNGTLLQEAPNTGQRRAEELARLLAGAGLTLPAQVTWISAEKDADGVDDWQSRRVTVELLP